MDYQHLAQLTVVKLREEAKKYPDVKGTSGMKKEELIELIAEKLGLAPKPETAAVGDKAAIKQKIRALKAQKQKALEENDHAKAKLYRRQVHNYKRRLRRLLREAARQAH